MFSKNAGASVSGRDIALILTLFFFFSACSQGVQTTPEYTFSDETDTINYIGDFYIELIEKGVPILPLPADNYRLKVEDRFDEIQKILRTYYPD